VPSQNFTTPDRFSVPGSHDEAIRKQRDAASLILAVNAADYLNYMLLKSPTAFSSLMLSYICLTPEELRNCPFGHDMDPPSRMYVLGLIDGMCRAFYAFNNPLVIGRICVPGAYTENNDPELPIKRFDAYEVLQSTGIPTLDLKTATVDVNIQVAHIDTRWSVLAETTLKYLEDMLASAPLAVSTLLRMNIPRTAEMISELPYVVSYQKAVDEPLTVLDVINEIMLWLYSVVYANGAGGIPIITAKTVQTPYGVATLRLGMTYTAIRPNVEPV